MRLGIYDRMSTEMARMVTEKMRSHTNVKRMSFLVYGLTRMSRLVHCQGGQLRANRHHRMTNAMMMPNTSMTMTNGTNSLIA